MACTNLWYHPHLQSDHKCFHVVAVAANFSSHVTGSAEYEVLGVGDVELPLASTTPSPGSALVNEKQLLRKGKKEKKEKKQQQQQQKRYESRPLKNAAARQTELVLRNVLLVLRSTCNILGSLLDDYDIAGMFPSTFIANKDDGSNVAILDHVGWRKLQLAGQVKGTTRFTNKRQASIPIHCEWPEQERSRWVAYKSDSVLPPAHPKVMEDGSIGQARDVGEMMARLEAEKSILCANPEHEISLKLGALAKLEGILSRNFLKGEKRRLGEEYGGRDQFLRLYGLDNDEDMHRQIGRLLVRAEHEPNEASPNVDDDEGHDIDQDLVDVHKLSEADRVAFSRSTQPDNLSSATATSPFKLASLSQDDNKIMKHHRSVLRGPGGSLDEVSESQDVVVPSAVSKSSSDNVLPNATSFGQVLLELQGWKIGRGLGVDSEGIKEPLQATGRWILDERGIGATKKDIKRWKKEEEQVRKQERAMSLLSVVRECAEHEGDEGEGDPVSDWEEEHEEVREPEVIEVNWKNILSQFVRGSD
ncbi:hypothetical protein LTR86_009575 [Recurvomyces mirabilis]|nr:hypothetical protein LTR86_009575 [Recurvomyces mirabilis]